MWVGLQRGHHIHPVQRVQVIEVHHMVVHVLLRDHQVADQVGRVGNLDFQGVFDGADRGERVDSGADATGALGEGPGLARVAARAG